jgi:hypothetical protein
MIVPIRYNPLNCYLSYFLDDDVVVGVYTDICRHSKAFFDYLFRAQVRRMLLEGNGG